MSIKHLAAGSKDVPLQEGKVRFYGMRFCPYAHRIHLVLDAKEIPHDVVYINLHNKPEWYLERYPSGRVPSIYVDGEIIYESLIIADYLDEAFPQRPLLRKDPLLKAQDRVIVEQFSKLHKLLISFFFTPILDPDKISPILKEMEYFEKELVKRGTTFFSGDQPGMVDYMIWPWFERFDVVAVLERRDEDFKKMLGWWKEMLEVPVVKKHSCSLEKYKKFFKLYKAGKLDYENLDV